VKCLVQILPLAVLLSTATAFGQHEPSAEHAGERAVHAAEGAEHPPGDAGGHHEGVDPKTLALQLLNFGVLLFILIKFGGSAINKSLRARHEQLKNDLEEANRLRQAAEARFKQQEKRLTNLESELEAMRLAIIKEAESEKARIIAAAEAQAAALKKDAEERIAAEIDRARVSLQREVTLAAVTVAEQVLREKTTAADQSTLVDIFVRDVNAGASS
jgi:F-type H+-transporting ATPase subunit b